MLEVVLNFAQRRQCNDGRPGQGQADSAHVGIQQSDGMTKYPML